MPIKDRVQVGEYCGKPLYSYPEDFEGWQVRGHPLRCACEGDSTDLLYQKDIQPQELRTVDRHERIDRVICRGCDRVIVTLVTDSVKSYQGREAFKLASSRRDVGGE